MRKPTSDPMLRFGLVHGMLDRPTVWDRLSPGLRERGSVVAPDFEWGSSALGNDQLVPMPTIERFGPATPDVIIAHSRGAFEVVDDLIARRVFGTGLVLIGWSNQSIERSREVIPIEDAELLEMCRTFISDRASVDGVELSTPRREWMARYAMDHFAGWNRNIHVDWSALAAVDCPTLFIVGDRDITMDVTEAEHAAAAMKNARLVVIPDAGHWPMLEHPTAVLESITSFLASIHAGE